MRIRGDGQLQHHFWGAYSATIAVGFDTGEQATLAAAALGEGWQVGGKDGTVVFGLFSGESLDVAEDTLVKFGADRNKIGSLRFSIDFGEPFEVLIEVEDPKQLRLMEV